MNGSHWFLFWILQNLRCLLWIPWNLLAVHVWREWSTQIGPIAFQNRLGVTGYIFLETQIQCKKHCRSLGLFKTHHAHSIWRQLCRAKSLPGLSCILVQVLVSMIQCLWWRIEWRVFFESCLYRKIGNMWNCKNDSVLHIVEVLFLKECKASRIHFRCLLFLISCGQELEHVDDLTLDEWWNVSVPPTPPSPLSNDILRGQKQLSFQVHENAESESATEDEHVQNQLPSEPSRPCMTISERLRHVRPTIPRTFKYGTCPHHQCALKPHVWGPNSMKRGKAALVCGKFWKVGENQKPLCWYYRPVTVAEVSTWSKYLQQKFFSLQNRFLRAGQNTV